MGLTYYGEKFHNGTPIEQSWMNRSNAMEFHDLTNYDDQYTEGAGRYQVGQNSRFLTMPAMLVGLQQLHNWGVDEIQEYCSGLVKPLLPFLKEYGIKHAEGKNFSPHMFGLELPDHIDMLALQEKMRKEQLYLSVRGQHLRVSTHVFNDGTDIEKLMDVIAKTLNK